MATGCGNRRGKHSPTINATIPVSFALLRALGSSSAGVMSAATPGETNRALAVIGADGVGTNGFVMMWLSESGKAYHVEWCDALPCGQWQPLGVVTAHGPIMLQSDTIPSVTSARFYRVTEPK